MLSKGQDGSAERFPRCALYSRHLIQTGLAILQLKMMQKTRVGHRVHFDLRAYKVKQSVESLDQQSFSV